MSRLISSAIACLAIAGCSSVDDDLKLMQGDWKLEQREVNGSPTIMVGESIVRIKGNTMSPPETTFTIEPGKKIHFHMRGSGTYKVSRNSLEFDVVWNGERTRLVLSH